jgi:hypothetical protein
MENADRILVFLLRAIAVAASLAVVPVFMPHAWMGACHGWLGLGTLPKTPIIVYLTRSLSATYAFHAGLLWIVARDVRRYAAIVIYVGLAFLVFGAVMLWIDIHAGLPWFWIAGEGPFTMGMGLAILVLQHRSAWAREQDHVG